MNINPLPLEVRAAAIAKLAEGLGPRAAQTLEGLSDGHLRSIMEAEAARLSSSPPPEGSGVGSVPATALAMQTC